MKTIRWGLLSTARINERLIPAIRETPRCELLAVASQGGLDKAAAYSLQWGIPRAYGSYQELLADPDVDVIYISLPNSLHAEWVIACALAGKHILCEKPMALSAADVDRMGAAARERGVILLDGVMMRYHPQTKLVRELVAGGKIGELRLIHGTFTFTLARPDDIRLDPALGGGSLRDLGSYCVSFMRSAVGLEPVEVQGWQVTNDAGVDVTFHGHLRFPNGAAGQFTSSFRAMPDFRAVLLGSEGVMQLDLPWINKVGVTSHVEILREGKRGAGGTFSDQLSEKAVEKHEFPDVNGYRCEVEAMAACVLDGAAPVVPLADTRATIATLEALYRSAREGRLVRLES